MKKFLAWTFIALTILVISVIAIAGFALMFTAAIQGDAGARVVLIMIGAAIGLFLFVAGLAWACDEVST